MGIDENNNLVYIENGVSKIVNFSSDEQRDAYIEGNYKVNVARIGEIQKEVKDSNRKMFTIEEQEIEKCMNVCNTLVDYLRLNNIEFSFNDQGFIEIKNRIR